MDDSAHEPAAGRQVQPEAHREPHADTGAIPADGTQQLPMQLSTCTSSGGSQPNRLPAALSAPCPPAELAETPQQHGCPEFGNTTQQPRPCETSSAVVTCLPVEVLLHSCAFLDPVSQACCARMTCKAVAEELGALAVPLRLSQPCPEHVFAAHWRRPGATRHLPLAQRRRLVCLVASSGVLANVRVAVEAAECSAPREALAVAAAAGRIDVCEFLWPLVEDTAAGPQQLEQNRPPPPPHPNILLEQLARRDPLVAAALAGRREVCAWLLARVERNAAGPGSSRSSICGGHFDITSAALAAALGGHTELYRALHGHLMSTATVAASGAGPLPLPLPPARLAAVVAEVGNVAALERVMRRLLRQHPPDTAGALFGAADAMDSSAVLAAAARSTTPDWLDKVDFLLGPACGFGWPAAGSPAHDAVAAAVMPRTEDVCRQLNRRGFWASLSVAGWRAVAAAGQAGILADMLKLAGILCCEQRRSALAAVFAAAAARGQAAGLRYSLLLAEITTAFGEVGKRYAEFATAAAVAAAEAGQLECLRVALHHVPRSDLKSVIMAALRSGHEHTAKWLVSHLLPPTPPPGRHVALATRLLAAAAESGSAALVRWLTDDRELRCGLLGPEVLLAAVRSGCCELVAWLAAQGCTGDPTAMYKTAGRAGDVAMLWELQEDASRMRERLWQDATGGRGGSGPYTQPPVPPSARTAGWPAAARAWLQQNMPRR
ncbi:hypothetical protein HYH02_011270 [Chlamydomonas schloesseri]|uniref:Uncharacterized protein n=1 Tax=Chlamydomonas schloesseri TaxID=2026947 RepID=A0A835TG36_9CHLO|nr:hypothetical protein HYH02_011270 [Chlamydomonas schloesseri]|eukprot:KAG2437631.1 hypothetical protein HYH02_011270 [Chlamydomonas schloesseri]